MAERGHRSRRRRKLSRRQFLAGSAAAGVALGMPAWLTGCGDDDGHGPAATTATPVPTATPTPGPGPREQRTLHFDLSYADVVDARLRALFSPHDNTPLTPHTEETRARFRADNPLLRGIADGRLTHFVDAVDLPADAMQQLWVSGRHAPSGEDALLGLQIHVPEAVRRTLAAAQTVSGEPRIYGAKVRAYNLERIADTLTLEDLAPALDEFVTPWDAAAAVVFHTPEIMNLNLEQGATIKELIEKLPCTSSTPGCDPFLGTLAFRIARNWPARQTPGGWATLQAIIDPDTGRPLLDEHGQTIYQTDLADETVAAAQQTIRGVLASIFNDRRFEGANWHALQGRTVSSVVAASGAGLRASGFELVAEHPAGTNVHGLDFVDLAISDAASRTVQMQVRNWH